MFKQKNALIAVAIAMALAACGGGGDDLPASPPPSQGGGNPPPGPINPDPVENAMTGQMILVSNHVLFNGSGQRLADFVNTAEGGGVYGQAEGTNSPLRTFGLRVMPDGMLPTAAGQSETVRVALELIESTGTAKEEIQILIDQVNFALAADNTWTVVVPPTAKLHLHVKSAAGAVADVVVDNPGADLVGQISMADDASSHGFMIDLEKAFASARTVAASDTAKMAVLDTVKDFAGKFNMNMTISRVNLQKASKLDPANAAETLALPGKDITVLNQPVVKGGGVQGFFWIKDPPPGV